MTTATKQRPQQNNFHEAGPPAVGNEMVRLDELASQYSMATIEAKGRFERALMLSEGMIKLREATRPIMDRIMPLQNSQLGFLTDQKGAGYSEQVVQECLIEATLRGVYPINNEFNILVGRCYITLNGYRRLVRELPGLTDLKMVPGVPKMFTSGAVVPYKATWKFEGIADSLEREIPVKLNSGMGADGAIGKATRKMLASIYGQITGTEHTEGEVDDSATVSRTEEVLAKLANKSQAATPSAGPEMIRKAQVSRLQALTEGMDPEQALLLLKPFNVESPDKLTAEQADTLIVQLESSREPGSEG